MHSVAYDAVLNYDKEQRGIETRTDWRRLRSCKLAVRAHLTSTTRSVFYVETDQILVRKRLTKPQLADRRRLVFVHVLARHAAAVQDKACEL